MVTVKTVKPQYIVDEPDKNVIVQVNAVAGPTGAPGTNGVSGDEAFKADAARNPDLLIVGTLTRNSDGAVTTAPVIWPDGTPGTYTALVLSTTFPGATDSYKITYGSPATKTYTQPTLTRDATGAVTNLPALVVT